MGYVIATEKAYRNTKAMVEKMEASLLEHQQRDGAELDPVMRQAVVDGMASLVEEWRAQMQEYEQLKAGKATLRIASLTELPKLLVKARLAAGLTQKQLAEKLGLKPQQIQRYEATDYRTITLSRAQEIAEALGLRWDATVHVGR